MYKTWKMVDEMNKRLDKKMLGENLKVYGYIEQKESNDGYTMYKTTIEDQKHLYIIAVKIHSEEEKIKVNTKVKTRISGEILEDNEIIIKYLVTCDELFRLIDSVLDKKDYEN